MNATVFPYIMVAIAQEVLPFPDPPSASVAGRTLDESTDEWRTTPLAQL